MQEPQQRPQRGHDRTDRRSLTTLRFSKHERAYISCRHTGKVNAIADGEPLHERTDRRDVDTRALDRQHPLETQIAALALQASD